jgi:hypothetical protein
MFQVQVTGKTLAECHNQILAMAEEIRNSDPGQPSKVTTDSNGFVAPLAFVPPVQQPVYDTAVPVRPNVGPAIDTGLDADGLPHDDRIHAGSKEKNANGKWKRRRGVDDAIVEQVTAQLKGSGQQTSQPVAPPAPIPTTNHHVALPENVSVLSQIPLQAQPVVDVAPAPTPVPSPAPNVHNAESFRTNIVTIISSLLTAGKINQSYVDDLKKWFGKDIYEWSNDTGKCQVLFTQLVQNGFVQGL